MRKLFSWLFHDYSNFGTTKITNKMIEKDFDSLYSYYRASGYTIDEAINTAIALTISKVEYVGKAWSENLRSKNV